MQDYQKIVVQNGDIRHVKKIGDIYLSKHIGADEFLKLTAGNIRMSTGIINTFTANLIRLDISKGNFVFFFLFKETKKDFTWGINKYPNFPVPDRLWIIKSDLTGKLSVRA